MTRFRTMLIAATALAGFALPTQAIAAPSYSVNIKAKTLDATLRDIARAGRVQIVHSDRTVLERRAPAIAGRLTVGQMLDLALRGSGFTWRYTNPNTITIVRLAVVEKGNAAPAQEAAPSQGEIVLPQIVVTGTRIARINTDTPAPIVTISGEEIRDSGEVELAEIVADLPGVSSTLNGGTVTGNVQNSGLDVVNLRNLGDNRTLVLIDGRRTVSNSGNGNRVSLNTIPTDFVDRIEVVTGGTSSVYGSDAVAGVVNIITESRLTGFRLGARMGVTDEGDGQERTVTGSFGTRFSGDRGYFLISGTWDQRDGILARDREFATRQVDFDYDATLGINEFDTLFINPGTSATNANTPTSGDQPASTFPPNIARDLSGATPGGVFYGSSSARDRFFNQSGLVPLGPDVQTGAPVLVGTTDNGNSGYFLPNRDGYNVRDLRNLLIPRDRYLVAAKTSYDLTDRLQLFAQVQFSRIDTVEQREPVGISFEDTFITVDPATGLGTDQTFGRIPCRRATGTGSGPCNPFVPAAIRADVTTGTTNQGVAWERRFNEVGNQITENRRETWRAWAGLKGDIGTAWNWEASVGYGRFDQRQIRRNEVIGRNLQFALNAEQVGTEIRCVDAAARAAGCVPVNLFGIGSISPTAANYIRADLTLDLKIEQMTAQAFATGELFDLPGGPFSLAFGADYRRDRQSLSGDELSQRGGTTGNQIPNFTGSIKAVEGFVEASAPLIADRPGIALLSLDASARVAHYDIPTVGTVLSWRGGIEYAPISDLKFRAQYARAQRAPDLAELFSPPRGDFDAVTDICDGVTPTTAGQIAVNCRAEPGVAAQLARLAADGLPQVFDPGTNTYSPNVGNRNLKEETADTFTAGGVLRPRFLPGLTISADYYNIEIRDAITSYTNDDLLRLCYDTTTASGSNPFCSDISRNPTNGFLTAINQRELNLAAQKVAGIDVAFDYRTRLSGVGLPGTITMRYDGTHVLKQSFSFNGLNGIETTDQLGELVSQSFKYRARGSIAFENDGFRIRWTAKYLGKIRDSNQRLRDYQQLLATVPNAEFPLFLNIPAVWEHDVNLSFDVSEGERRMRFFGGVNNVFDKTSPFLPTGTSSGRLTNANATYDLAGRRFYAGVRVEF